MVLYFVLLLFLWFIVLFVMLWLALDRVCIVVNWFRFDTGLLRFWVFAGFWRVLGFVCEELPLGVLSKILSFVFGLRFCDYGLVLLILWLF